MSGSCLVVMYHYVRDSAATAFPAIRALSPADFERQLDWLQREFTLIGADELEAALAGTALPPRAALLTFDDGFAEHHDVVLPILRRRGLRGIFFVAGAASGPERRMLAVHKTHFLLARLGAEAFARAVVEACASASHAGRASQRGVFGTDAWELPDERALKNLLNYELPFDEADAVLSTLFERHIGDDAAFARELYLSEAQIATMAQAGMAFGYHTHTHRMLSRLTADEQAEELAGGVAAVQRWTGQQRVSFCYPWGGRGTYTADTLAVLEEAGYSMAFNTVRRMAHPGRDGRFELPRLDTRDLPPHVDDWSSDTHA